jgi:16S rRNA A1518/A1519 N6-dimethyltransferase RsmA/KsgA/DIM1 with predicted DNA glycosylase/AP lyase activity
MPIINDVKNALFFLCRGEFKELLFRLRVYMGKVDLHYASLEELGLSADRSHDYAHSGGAHLEKVLSGLKINPRDAIIDFGSGKGGVLITLAKFPFAKITGVELLPELVAIAEQNLKILNISNVTMVLCDAADFTELEEYNFFYFYNPFPRSVMDIVVHNICVSLRKKPRPAHLIYCNPVFHDILVANSPFHKTEEFYHQQIHQPIYVYSNKP